MKKLLLGVMVGALSLSLMGCSQYLARSLGGDYTHELPQGEKLVNATWKEESMWYLTKPMTEDDIAETYTFQADSVFGVFEGTVTIIESK